MRSLLLTVGRALRWHRRLVAAACAALAVYAILIVLTTRDGDTAVVAAARPVAGGQVVAAADVTTLRLPAAAVPEGAFTEPSEVIGQAVAAPVPVRGVFTRAGLLTGGSLVGPGRVALPVVFDGSSPQGLLRVGDRIDLLGVGGSGRVEVVAADVRVAALPEIEAGGLFSGGGSRAALVDLTPAEAATVTAAATASSLNFALR